MIFCCHCHCVIRVILYILRYGYEYKKYFFFYDNSYTCIVINVIKLNLIISSKHSLPKCHDYTPSGKLSDPEKTLLKSVGRT